MIGPALARPSTQRWLAALLAASILVGAWLTSRGDAPPPGAARLLPTTGLRVRVPDPIEVTSLSHGDRLTLRPGARTPLVLDVELVEDHDDPGAHDSLEAEGGLSILYRVTRTEGGSGGAEADVHALVHTARGWVGLRCRVQAESDVPERECLAVLATLRER